MEFKNTELSYVEEAVSLAMQEYQAECKKNSQLLSSDFKEKITDILSWLFGNQYGKVAIEDGKLMGYLAFAGPWDGCFGNCKGVFSPLVGSAFTGKDRGKLSSMLFQEVAEEMARDNICSYAVSYYAHDEEVMKSFVLNGFGIRCSDAMLHLTERKIVEQLEEGYSYCELLNGDKQEIRELEWGLIEHLSKAPALFPSNLEDSDESSEEDGRRVFVIKKENEILGYLKLSMDEAETFITAHEKVANLCGAFLNPKYRGQGITENLLEYVCQICEQEGMEYLGVDCETLNPTALRFWGKYFTNYTYSLARRIDERIVGYSEYFEKMRKKTNSKL